MSLVMTIEERNQSCIFISIQKKMKKKKTKVIIVRRLLFSFLCRRGGLSSNNKNKKMFLFPLPGKYLVTQEIFSLGITIDVDHL